VTAIEGNGLHPGMLADVRISGVTEDGDFSASLVRVAEASPPAPVLRTRHLPLATTIGSFGR
jgi:hypothetical protein